MIRKLSLFAPLLLAACNSQPAEQSEAPLPTALPTPTPTPTPAAAAPETPDTAGSTRRNCHLAVDGTVHVDGPCLVFPMGPDQYTLNTWDQGKPARSHFAMVTTDASGTTTASWNADPNDTRAGDPLGTVTKDGDCWVNTRARICAR
ncbi:hypothetical protein GRI97_06140 [Altererythrobacter xixiisoli]|uniref:Lipoprotein n=1 Tax=Croceibacterium xixiisoli TaxID=1476466 RepID=A0A6I4TQV1_9SPHN|nr:hypothetical protein [Croceibacterium xixiisoli]MXO98565.1 hypothetical protein [Croceibacterium xixiisoli]